MPHGNTLTPYRDTLTTHGGAGETITHQGGLRDGPGDRLSGLEDTLTTCGELGSGMEGSHDSEDTPTLCDRPRDSLTPHDELKNLDSYADTLFISGLQNPVSRKRGERPSPLPSPMKLTRLPVPKLQRRLRTGTEGKYPQDQLHVHPQEFPHCPIHQSRHLTLSHFLCNDNERDSQHELEGEMNSYIILYATLVELLQTADVLPLTTKNRGLVNKFTQKVANPAQRSDLLNFQSLGQQEFLQRVSSVILKTPSVQTPNRKHRLQTFSEKKVTKSRVSQLEKDRKLIITAMKKKNAIFTTNRYSNRPSRRATNRTTFGFM